MWAFTKMMNFISKNRLKLTMYLNWMNLYNFPVSAAFVERLFSKLKTAKDCLRNQWSQRTLEGLQMIAIESPKQGDLARRLQNILLTTLKEEIPNMRLKL